VRLGVAGFQLFIRSPSLMMLQCAVASTILRWYKRPSVKRGYRTSGERKS
jgi:hypothetical protein